MHALPALGVISYLFYRWFVIADRHIIFLYYHPMGAGFDTTPFGRETASRYFMAGLVACGAVMSLYTAAGWLMGRLLKGYRGPDWQRVWALSAAVLLIGIPILTVAGNTPALRPLNVLQVTAFTLAGLGLALVVWRTAVRRARAFFWLALDGWGLFLVMGGVSSGLSNLGSWLARGRWEFVVAMGLMIGVGLAWLAVVTALRAWRRTPVPSVLELVGAGLAVSYVLMPFVHHVYVIQSDGYAYITDSGNFFANTVPRQLGAWLIAGALVAGLSRLRKAIASRRAPLRWDEMR